MNFRRTASASLRPCRCAAPLRGRPTRSGGGAPLGTLWHDRGSATLTRAYNLSTSSTQQQETPQSFNNERDIPVDNGVEHPFTPGTLQITRSGETQALRNAGETELVFFAALVETVEK